MQMACKTVELNRSTYYYTPEKKAEEERLVKRMHELSWRYPRYGYEMITKKLRQEGWRVNKKRIQRLWRLQGLKVTQKQQKRARINCSTVVRQAALYPNHVWSWDFIFDRTDDGKQLKILNVVDEYSRFNIVLKVKRHFRAEDVIVAIGEAMLRYGIPGCIRSDNGPEFVSKALQAWLNESGVGVMYIEPGSPWQNPYVESLNARLRDECLNRELFTSLLETQIVLAEWRKEYNHERPHGAHDGQTPAQIYEKFIPSQTLRGPGTEFRSINFNNREYYH